MRFIQGAFSPEGTRQKNSFELETIADWLNDTLMPNEEIKNFWVVSQDTLLLIIIETVEIPDYEIE